MNNRREFLTKAAALAAVATAIPLLPASATSITPLTLPSLKGRKVLVTYGGWDGHEPAKWADYISSWLKDEGAEVQSFNSLDPYTDKTLMGGIDLVIQSWTMSQISKEQEAGLLEAIRDNGTGMAGWHGGMGDAFRNNTEYQFMTGGQWVAHPGGQVDYDIHITDSKDDVTKGLKDFHIKSEQYYMHVDPNVKVLATTKFNGATNAWIDGAVLPVAWKKTYGKGRVFYSSLGHNVSHVTGSPEALEIMKRGVKWTSASKYEPAEKWMSPVYKY